MKYHYLLPKLVLFDYINSANVSFNLVIFFVKVTSINVSWTEFLCYWPLWAVYIAQFSMNWSNYIIMQWLPTYLSKMLGANKESLSLTAMPYVINSLVGVGKI